MKRKLYILLFRSVLFLMPFSGWSQVINRDSLLQLLPTMVDDSNKVNCLTTICFSYVGRNDDSILYYVKKLDEVAVRLNHQKGLMNVENMNGMVLMNKGDLKGALERYTHMLKIARENDFVRGVNIAYLNMSAILIKLNEFEKALDNYYHLLPALEKNNDKKNKLFAYMNMAVAFAQTKRYDSSYIYSQKAYLIAGEFKQFHSQIEILDNIGNVFATQKMRDSAKYYYEKALAIIDREKMYDLKKRVQYNMALLKSEGYDKDITTSEFHKVLSLMDTGRSDVTLVHETYAALANHFEKNKNYDSAFYYLRRQNEMAKNIFTDLVYKNANEIHAKYQTEIKQQQIALLEKENNFNKLRIQKEAQQKYYAVVGLVGIFLACIYFFYLYSKKNNLNNRLTTSLVNLNQAQTQLIQLEKEKEAEAIRLRISRDIHDDIGSNLTKIAMLGNLTSSQAKDKMPEAVEQLEKISDYARNVNSSMSEIIWAINPKQDTLENLLGYMRVHILEFLKDSDIGYQINFPEVVPVLQLNPDLKRGLFLVLKESLNNAVKHSEAKNIIVSFLLQNNHFELSVADDGKGINTDSKGKTLSGNGLPNLEARMKHVDCSFTVVSSAGNGCKVTTAGSL